MAADVTPFPPGGKPGIAKRLHALTTPCELPPMVVDLAVYRRLLAMQARMVAEDPSLAAEEDMGFEHVIYAAICAGVRASEAEAGVRFDENTGEGPL